MNPLMKSKPLPQTAPSVLEQQFAQRVTQHLGGHQPRLHPHIERRLSAARCQAIEAATRVRRLKAMATAATLATAGAQKRFTPWWARFASFVPALALTLGLIAIDKLNLMQRIEAAAEVDAALLADGLPPAAYADPGFAEFLRQPPP